MRKIFSFIICAVMAVLMAVPGYALTVNEITGDMEIGTYPDGTKVTASVGSDATVLNFYNASGEWVGDVSLYRQQTMDGVYTVTAVEFINNQLVITKLHEGPSGTENLQYFYNSQGDEVGDSVPVSEAPAPSTEPINVQIDKTDYAPGETMTVTVTGGIGSIDRNTAYFQITGDFRLGLTPVVIPFANGQTSPDGSGVIFSISAPNVASSNYSLTLYPSQNGRFIYGTDFGVEETVTAVPPAATAQPTVPTIPPAVSAQPTVPTIPPAATAQPIAPTMPVQLPVVPQTAKTVFPTPSVVFVNGVATAFEAYNIDGSNYFKLRDIAFSVNNTAKQFNTGYDSQAQTITVTSGQAYVPVGGEMQIGDGTSKLATPTSSRMFINGAEVNFLAYQINGNNFFKMVDIAGALNFGIAFNETTGAISVDTNAGFTGVNMMSDAQPAA